MSKKRRELIKLLKTSETIKCLDIRSYLTLLQLSIEITSKNLEQRVARLVKAY